MSGKDWVALFHNIDNKHDLHNLFAIFFRKSYLRDIRDVDISRSPTWSYTLYYKDTNTEIVSKVIIPYSLSIYVRVQKHNFKVMHEIRQ